MALKSSIEWTESTWNPLTGCTKISPGCKNCYAERMSKRLQSMKVENYKNGFELTIHNHVLNHPLAWKRPQMIFVNSMSDLFHKDVPIEFILSVFDVMRKANWHIFQLLTKRPERLSEINQLIDWPDNVWMGTSVENQDYVNRIDFLRESDAFIKFLSLEPLIGPIDKIDLGKIDWVIVGGESGPKSRPMKMEWVVKLKELCKTQDVPFFFKQWGGFNKKKNGRLLEGKTWDEYPLKADLTNFFSAA